MRPHHSLASSQNSSAARPSHVMPLMRKYRVEHLNAKGDVQEFSQIAPSLPIFEDAFAAICRGALIMTKCGPIAIEDLLPGMEIQTLDNGFQTLLWKGSTTLVPDSIAGPRGQSTDMGHLTRITADSFGLGRPMPDLMLGPKARMLVHHHSIGPSLMPITAQTNGETIFEVTPIAPAPVFHLAFESQQIFRVNGLEIESYHPGPSVEMSMSREMFALFMALFPHCETAADFGKLCRPRLDETSPLGSVA
ncbi:Hint domain-containing protein [Falsihalocynthiibacter sp. SS001]|uniref:Hint domain-containing protein n=1 Tax=Falsihalocynthiibacter sp. SS001 TaxID=3349698 RepID=UPI0036D40771